MLRLIHMAMALVRMLWRLVFYYEQQIKRELNGIYKCCQPYISDKLKKGNMLIFLSMLIFL